MTAGRPRGTSCKSLSVSRPGQVVDPAEPRVRPRIIWDSCSNRGPRTRVRDAQDSWSTPRALRHWPVTSGSAGQHRGPSNPSPSHPGQQIDGAGARTRVQNAQGRRSTLRDMELVSESPERAGRPCGPNDTSVSRPKLLVDPTESWSRARVAREGSSIPWAVRHNRE